MNPFWASAMPSPLNYLISKNHRHTRAGRRDQRAIALHLAGTELLARSDFEKVSIAKIAKAANCSVGAFYYRYKDKNAYLRELIEETFGGLRRSLQTRLSNSGGQISLSEFLSHIVTKISAPEKAGIIRAALKLGATNPDALRSYEDYRKFVAMTAENIFEGGAKKKIRAKEIREAIQIVFAAINDAALMPKSATMKLGSDDMLNSLCEMAARHIGVKPDYKGKIAKKEMVPENVQDEAPAIIKKNLAPPKNKLARRKRGKAALL